MRSKFQKISLGFLAVLVLFSSVVGSLASVTIANAQITIVESIPDKTKGILDTIWEVIKTVVLNATVRLVSYAIRKVAYDSAVWLASGGKGQTPFAQVSNFGDYMKNVGDEAFGTAIESISKDVGGPGFNLCKIPDIQTDLAMKVGLRLPGFSGLGGIGNSNLPNGSKRPSCSWSDFSKNWLTEDSWKSKFNSTGQSLTSQFNQAIQNPSQSDFGVQLDSLKFIEDTVSLKQATEQLQRLEGQGYLAKTSLISGQILTPAGIIKKDFEKNTPGDQQEKDEQQISALLSSGDIKVLPTILSIFLNSLVSTMAKNFQEKGTLPFGVCVGNYGGEQCKQGAGGVANYEAAGVLGGRRAAQELFSSFLAVVVKPIEQYDLVGQLSSCPDNPGLYNCRMDEDMEAGVRQAEGGTPATIKDALDSKNHWLHGEWKLIPPGGPQNSDRNFCKTAYCYSNLQVLRQTRILPLGFEIAAKNSNPNNFVTLQKVVDGFNDCQVVNGQIVSDPSKPYCHLIDPNWVLKATASRCNASVPGPVPLAEGSPDRSEECADLATCVNYNPDGSCLTYGYCTSEKNTWDFGIAAEKCSVEFRTCRAFSNVATGQTANYIHRSIDSGFCKEENIGCNYYSLTEDVKTGRWQGPGINQKTRRNNGIYFNSKIADATCGTGSAGCSVFQIASAPDKMLPLKKAPDYLGCYNLPTGDAPQTIADLKNLQPDARCSNYASVCTADEVDCRLFTPRVGFSLPIPGKFNNTAVTAGGDVCDAKCVGYNAYREMPSNYSNGQNLTYLVPSSGQTCGQTENGCVGFTNLNSVSSGGGEQVENYTYLRPCVLPAKSAEIDTTKTFITYEGGDTGFQLKTYRLVAELDQTGKLGPAYWYKTLNDKIAYDQSCNEQTYKSGAPNPDCRQFNDDQGTIYYRLLSKTIPVSESCTEYRLNSTELDDAPSSPIAPITKDVCAKQYRGFWNESDQKCQICFQNGELRDGACLYKGLPGGVSNSAGGSLTCRAEAESCHQFKGNAGNNIKDIIPNDNFENPDSKLALAGWGPLPSVTQSKESTNRDGHSLGYKGGGSVARRLPPVTPGKSYNLTFWAKGTSATLAIALNNTDQSFSQPFGAATIGDAWQRYTMGPLEWTDSLNHKTTTSTFLSFTSDNGGQIYLDNIQLTELARDLYLIKDSLKVDAVCDSHPEDNLPGEALGCSAYTDQNNTNVNLVGFSFLCREGAIGCTGFLDTQNTPADLGPRLYRVWLPGSGGATSVVSLKAEELGRCTVPVGQTGCYVNEIFGVSPSDLAKAIITNANGQPTNDIPQLVKSTVFIPADTATTTPLYLVANKEASCNQVDVGCSFVGKQINSPLGPVFVTNTLKNNPENYKDALCESEAESCNKYTAGDGTYYFKEPSKICTYKTDVTVNKEKRSGWFQKGVGMCAGNGGGGGGGGGAGGKLCTKNSECGLGAECKDIGNQPCYPTYQENGGTFGLWSYGATSTYQGFVGECSESKNLCTEFIDHNDNNKAYYYIKNDSVGAGDCVGQVSRKAGCALFDQTDNPNKYWLTAATYQKSEAEDGKLVDVIQAPADQRDANVIIKVKRNRECSEWLQCTQTHRVFNKDLGKFTNVCDAVGRCDGTTATGNCGAGIASDYSGEVFTESRYISRPVGWSGKDYDGYTLLGLYPVEELTQINVTSSSDHPDWRLMRKIPCGTNCADKVDPKISSACKNNNSACGTNSNLGTCINGVCVRGVTGENSPQKVLGESIVPGQSNAPAQICRAFPEKNSPFPDTPQSLVSQSLHNVNRCDERAVDSIWAPLGYACECDYKKVAYGDALTKYFNYKSPNIAGNIPLIEGGIPMSEKGKVPSGICQGGDNDASACSSDIDCYSKDPNDPGKKIPAGICLKKKKEDSLLGWKGFCLEPDSARNINGDQNKFACLTWYPVDNLLGAADINSLHAEAGYKPPALGGRYYCLAGNRTIYNVPDPKATEMPEIIPTITLVHAYSYAYDKPGFYYDSSKYEPLWGPPVMDGNDSEFHRFRIGNKNFQAPQTDINQNNIERVIFRVDNAANQGKDNPLKETIFEIWPNDALNDVNYKGPQVIYKWDALIDGGTPNGVAVTGRYLGRKNEFLLLVSDNGYLKEDGTFCYPDCSQLNGNPFVSTLDPAGLRMGKTPLADSVAAGKPDPNGFDGLWDQGVKEALCNSKNGGNWHAVRMRFDNAGNFLGYDTAYCDKSNDSGGISYSVEYKVRQRCTFVADALVDIAAEKDNPRSRTIGFTDRLWKHPNNKDYSVNFGDVNGKNPNSHYAYDLAVGPFGSISTNDQINGSGAIIYLSQFIAPDLAKKGGCKTDGTSKCTYRPSITAVHNDFLAGAPYSCPGGGCYRSDGTTVFPLGLVNQKIIDKQPTDGAQYLGELFARFKDVYDYVGGSYKPTNFALAVLDLTPQLKDTAPQIHPLGACVTSDQCVEQNVPGVTINGKSNVGEEVVSFTNSLPVSLQFFAFADSNKMPLRDVKIDWDLGGVDVPASNDGLHRNHRGLIPYTCGTKDPNKKICINDSGNPEPNPRSCSTNSDCIAQTRCVKDPTSFGFIEGQTCDNTYFQYTNIYNCTKESDRYYSAEKDKCGKNKEAFPDGCCVFQPKVQVKDNWGWCSGDCESVPPAFFPSKGCYDGSWDGISKDFCIKDTAWIRSNVKIILSPNK